MADTLLDIVDENDNVIGRELRSRIHKEGLLHREIHIWFITPNKEIVFQKRSMRKETNPGLLTVAVGGHVESGSTHDETALIEATEETGLELKPDDLHYFMTVHVDIVDALTGAYNQSLRAVYGVLFKGRVEDLKVEEGDSEGYVTVPLDQLIPPSPDIQKIMSPRHIEDELIPIHEKLIALLD